MIIVIIAKLFVIFTKILIHSKNVNINQHESNKGLVYIISNRIKHVVIKRKRVVVLLEGIHGLWKASQSKTGMDAMTHHPCAFC